MTNTLPTDTLNMLLIGGPTLRFDYGGLVFLTDPTFDSPQVYRGNGVTVEKLTGPAVGPDALDPIDVVLLSHDEHIDNLDVSGRAFLPQAGRVLSTPGAATRIPGVVGLANWENVVVGEVTITGVPALHGPNGAEERNGVVTGFVLRSPGLPTVYVSGDNASTEVVAQVVARSGPIDVAVLFTGAANVGRFGDIDVTLNARTAVAAAELLGDAAIVPIHAEGWGHYSETRDRLLREFTYAGLADRLILARPGTQFVPLLQSDSIRRLS